jgi:hypothetical protein
LATVVLEVGSKSGVPMTTREKFRLRTGDEAIRKSGHERLNALSKLMSNHENGAGQKQSDGQYIDPEGYWIDPSRNVRRKQRRAGSDIDRSGELLRC